MNLTLITRHFLGVEALNKEIAKVEKSADDAKVTMRHFEDAIKKVREQKDLKIGQKVELSAFR